MTVRTRFAPSPTGLLHIGGARTALFNYLFARHHGGQFLLRIEDTDRARSTQPFTQAILDSLGWLGLDPDEPPVFQSTRAARHAEVAWQMLAAGHAYRCYATAEELAAMRERARAEGRAPRYDGRWRDRDGPLPDAPFALRLRAPQTGETVVDDLVQGSVRVANSELDDMIILRSDGSPTYLHAVVVDDHDMAHHPCDPRRRPPDQHLPSAPGLSGDGLDTAAGLRPHPADPRRRRGQAVEAPRCRVSVTRIPRGRGFCRRRSATTCCGSAGATATAEVLVARRGDPAVRPRRRRPCGASRMDYAKLTHINGVWHAGQPPTSARTGRCGAAAPRPGTPI